MRILGLDPGLAKSGYGFINYEDGECSEIQYGTITTPKTSPLPQRLQQIYDELVAVIDVVQPTIIAVEDLFFCANVKTVIVVAQAKGVMLLTSAHSHCPVHEYTPLQIKQAITGYGRATKRQVQEMVKTILSLEKIPRPDHAADALAVALCHAHGEKFRRLAGL